MSTNNFGAMMKAERKRRGMTQAALGEILGVTPAHISSVERGGKSSEMLEKLFCEKMDIHHSTEVNPAAPPPLPLSMARSMLLDEIEATRKELGRPMPELEKAAWARAEEMELLSASILLWETLVLRASRDTLAGTQAFRRKQEAAESRQKN